MAHSYDDLDTETRAALGLTRDDLLDRLGTRATIYSSNEQMIQALADQILDDCRRCREAEIIRRLSRICPGGVPSSARGWTGKR